jgi:hypothetical protein
MTDHKVDTSEDTPPVFPSWNYWYAIIITANLVFILFMYFYFKSL